jgi:hypothetical protein
MANDRNNHLCLYVCVCVCLCLCVCVCVVCVCVCVVCVCVVSACAVLLCVCDHRSSIMAPGRGTASCPSQETIVEHGTGQQTLNINML